jgi:hypothetical protein
MKPPHTPEKPSPLTHAVARWALAHSGWVVLVVVSLWVAAGYWQCRWSLRAMALEQAAHPGQPLKMPSEAQRPLWIWFGAAAAWLSLRSALAAGRKWTKVIGLPSWDERVRQRVLTGEPVPPRMIKLFGAFGLLGCLAAVALSLRLVDWITWGEPAGAEMRFTVSMGLIALFALLAGASLVRSALEQSEWESLAVGHEKELAEALLEEERAESEAETEEERETISGPAYAVFLAGLLGGIFLMSRLPDAEGGCAFVSSMMAMMWSGCSVYMAKRRVTRWKLWSALLAVAVAGLVGYFVWQFGVKAWWALAGVAWGAGFGVAIGTLYVRRLERLEGEARKGFGASADRGRGGKPPPGGITKM